LNFCVIISVWNFNKRIEFVIRKAKSFFDHIIVLDTDSTDGSVEILRDLEKKGLVEFYHYKKDRGAGRDANFLLDKANVYKPKWIVKLDHDEYYEDALYDELDEIKNLTEKYGWIMSKRITLWRDTGKYRVDGRYRWFVEKIMFRWRDRLSFPQDAIHHMERVPETILKGSKGYKTKARLIHLSQIYEERAKLQVDRLKEFNGDWSNDLLKEKVKLRNFHEKTRRE